MQIPAPKFEIYETVKPTPDAMIQPASPVGKVESRSWVQSAERPGYWRYTVRWPGGGTSSESDEYLDKGCRVDCGLRVVVDSGAPVIVRSWTTQSVDAAIGMALKAAGVAREGATGWTLRTEDGAELKHMVGDAKLEDEGETTLFLDPEVGGGEQGGEVVESGYIYTGPVGSPGPGVPDIKTLCIAQRQSHHDLRESDPAYAEYHRGAELAYALIAERLDQIRFVQPALSPRLSDEDRERIADTRKALTEADPERPTIGDGVRDAWQGTEPAEGTRRALILGVIDNFAVRLISGAGGKATKRSCLNLADEIEAALLKIDIGADPTGEVSPASTAMDVLDGLRIDRTRDGAILDIGQRVTELADKFVEQRRRDDSWVSEVAHQAGGAVSGVFLREDPTKVMPAEECAAAVAEILTSFGVKALGDHIAEEQLEHGRKEARPGELREYDPDKEAPPTFDEAPGGDDPAATIEFLEGEVERLLGGREEARTREGRFAEERDCAFALLRWLLPVTVAKRLD